MRCKVLQLVRAFAYPATIESNNQNYGKISLTYKCICAPLKMVAIHDCIHMYIMNNSVFFFTVICNKKQELKTYRIYAAARTPSIDLLAIYRTCIVSRMRNPFYVHM